MKDNQFGGVCSGVEETLEFVYESEPVNFSFSQKTNSQVLRSVFPITWPVSMAQKTFLEAKGNGTAGTNFGKIAYVAVDFQSGIPVKTRKDLDLATTLFELSGS